MSEKLSNKNYQTNWAALEKMDDDDIDYSDIPPLSDVFFENATLRVPTPRVPTHPGEMLHKEFLQPMNITPKELAGDIHVPLEHINDIVSGQASVTPSSALRLAKYFRTSADLWMTLQLRWDLYHAQQVESKALASIQPRQPV